MSINDYQEGEIIEPTEWRNPEEQSFNHQLLIMKAMTKCLELGSKEMKEGYWNEKADKFGNIVRTYVEDTRRAFIESVKTLMMFMECDYDSDAKEIINSIKEKMVERKKYWLEQEWTWWCSLSPTQQQYLSKEGKSVVRGFFNKKHDFDNYYFEEELDFYRKICSELNQLSKRLDFYTQPDFIN